MRVTVLADTHLHGDLARKLPANVLAAIDEADVVLHAGDIVSPDALEELNARTRTIAVLGNNDRDLAGLLSETKSFELDGLRVAMIHDSGSSTRRAARLWQLFPEADLVVFGHSHVPYDEIGIGAQRLFNPGSPTQRRSQARHSFGRLVIEDATLLEHVIERF